MNLMETGWLSKVHDIPTVLYNMPKIKYNTMIILINIKYRV